MAAQNFSQYPYEACLIDGLSSDVQHQILNIGNYVFRPLNFILAFLAFVFNTLVITAVARTKSLQYPAMVIMCSLAVTDILFPLYSMFRYIETFTHEHMCAATSHEHPLYFAIGGLCTLATLGNLAVISRDRYLAVRRPVWYRNHMTISRAFKAVCLAWLISMAYAFATYLSILLGGVYAPVALAFVLLFFPFYVIVIAFCYLSIYCRKNIQVGNLNDIFLKRQKRLANTVAWILLILVLTYFPGLLFGGVLVANGVNNLPFRPYYITFVQLNGALNPLLNFSRIKKMRKAIKDLFRSHSQLQSSSLANNNNNSNNDSITYHNNSHTTATTAITHTSSNNYTDPVIAMTYEKND